MITPKTAIKLRIRTLEAQMDVYLKELGYAS